MIHQATLSDGCLIEDESPIFTVNVLGSEIFMSKASVGITEDCTMPFQQGLQNGINSGQQAAASQELVYFGRYGSLALLYLAHTITASFGPLHCQQ
jgi:hypothetical protein